MPKTNIYPPRTSAADATNRVEVGWHPGGVQVATAQRAGTDTEPVWQGDTYVDLDRAGINTLIRALREGRDKAYGRDE